MIYGEKHALLGRASSITSAKQVTIYCSDMMEDEGVAAFFVPYWGLGATVCHTKCKQNPKFSSSPLSIKKYHIMFTITYNN
jgi:hypothetical protein